MPIPIAFVRGGEIFLSMKISTAAISKNEKNLKFRTFKTF